MELMYSSTRNDKVKLTASQAILKGLADDGGLFVPERIPALDVPMDTLAAVSYTHLDVYKRQSYDRIYGSSRCKYFGKSDVY